MLTEDIIRKAVELAPGFKWLHRDQVEVPDLNNPALRPFEQQWFLDALAAALVRVAHKTKRFDVRVGPRGSVIYDMKNPTDAAKWGCFDADETENTINAIVEFADKHPEIFDA